MSEDSSTLEGFVWEAVKNCRKSSMSHEAFTKLMDTFAKEWIETVEDLHLVVSDEWVWSSLSIPCRLKVELRGMLNVAYWEGEGCSGLVEEVEEEEDREEDREEIRTHTPSAPVLSISSPIVTAVPIDDQEDMESSRDRSLVFSPEVNSPRHRTLSPSPFEVFAEDMEDSTVSSSIVSTPHVLEEKEEEQSLVKQLTEMGFDEADSRTALLRYRENDQRLSLAIHDLMLLSSSREEEETTASPSFRHDTTQRESKKRWRGFGQKNGN